MDLKQCAPRAGNSDKTPASPPRSKERPETGSIGILFNGQSTQSTSDPERAESTFCKFFPPDEKYRLQMRRELGNSFLAVDANCSGRLVAVKEYKWRNSEDNLRLLRTSHTNIVNLLDAFLVEDVFHFVYELMEVSLKELASSVKLEENHISFVCKEVRHHRPFFSPLCEKLLLMLLLGGAIDLTWTSVYTPRAQCQLQWKNRLRKYFLG